MEAGKPAYRFTPNGVYFYVVFLLRRIGEGEPDTFEGVAVCGRTSHPPFLGALCRGHCNLVESHELGDITCAIFQEILSILSFISPAFH
jgi:hypothetical protein